MAEEQEVVVDQTPEPQGEEEVKPTTDWKAEARKWEARAKKSEAAEAELDALKQAQMTEQEKITQRAEKAEAELAEVKAKAQRMEDARTIAERDNVPLELLEFCADAEAMEDFSRIYQTNRPTVHSAPTARSSKILAENSNVKATQESQFVKTLFNRD